MNQFTAFIQSSIRAEPWPPGSLQLPRLQIHRGFHADGLQENTITAFQKAAEVGATMCELDVRLSGDQVPVVVHDADLVRIAQKKLFVRESTAVDLRKEGVVPSLSEVLSAPGMPQFFNIELKTSKIDDRLMREVAKVVSYKGKQSAVIFSSFNPFALWMMQNLLPDVPRALLVTEEDGDGNNAFLKKMVFAPFLKIHMLNLNERMIDQELMKQFLGRMPISAWTVNDKTRAEELLKWGVRSIISDRFLFS